jgi:hypothetical protein
MHAWISRRTVSRRWLLVACLTIPLVLGGDGCYRKSRVGEAEGEILVEVENRNFLDVVIYAVQGGGRIRVGDVTGTSSKTFVVQLNRISMGGEVRFMADPIGSGRAWTTEALHVFAGQTVQLTIESDVRRSTLSIRG